MSVDVSAVVVSYNARGLLPECVDSVLASAEDGLTVEVIVVDNDSTDGSAELVRERYPGVRVVEAGRNGGMAAGNNLGMQGATGRHFLLLNSDARLLPGALRTMVECADGDSNVGMVGPRLLNVDGSLQRSVRGFPTVWRLATEFWFLRKLAPRSRALNAFYQGWFDHATTLDVEWFTGACMLVPRHVVDQVGLMDESFFMFSEETDWAMRMHAAGLAVRFVADAQVVHLGGGSTKGMWERMYRVQVANHVRVLALHGGPRTARRARAVLRSALLLRAVAWRIASAGASGERRADWRERSLLAQAARAELATLDIGSLADRQVPPIAPQP